MEPGGILSRASQTLTWKFVPINNSFTGLLPFLFLGLKILAIEIRVFCGFS